MKIIEVTEGDWRTMVNGGYIVVKDPTLYSEVFSYAGSFCVWHREVA